LLLRAQPSDAAPELEVAVLTSRAGALEKMDVQSVRVSPAPAPEVLIPRSKLDAVLPLSLRLSNAGRRTIDVQLGDARTELILDVQGPGVVRRPAARGVEPEVLRPRTIRLAPGEEHLFRIDRLVAGSRGHVEVIELTEPGNYTLTAQLLLPVDGRMMTLRSETMGLKVVQPLRP
jgi:hypothetical protein